MNKYTIKAGKPYAYDYLLEAYPLLAQARNLTELLEVDGLPNYSKITLVVSPYDEEKRHHWKLDGLHVLLIEPSEGLEQTDLHDIAREFCEQHAQDDYNIIEADVLSPEEGDHYFLVIHPMWDSYEL